MDLVYGHPSFDAEGAFLALKRFVGRTTLLAILVGSVGAKSCALSDSRCFGVLRLILILIFGWLPSCDGKRPVREVFGGFENVNRTVLG